MTTPIYSWYVRKWQRIYHLNWKDTKKMLKRNYLWQDSTIKKFRGINPNSKTGLKIIFDFSKNKFRQYKPYNLRFPNWEYLVLLKLVYLQILKIRVKKINGRNILTFKLSVSKEKLVERFFTDLL